VFAGSMYSNPPQLASDLVGSPIHHSRMIESSGIEYVVFARCKPIAGVLPSQPGWLAALVVGRSGTGIDIRLFRYDFNSFELRASE
jgi:hypothetical protein